MPKTIECKYVRPLDDGTFEYGSVGERPIEEFRPAGTAATFLEACELAGVAPPKQPAPKRGARR